jgi:hypothetical protein
MLKNRSLVVLFVVVGFDQLPEPTVNHVRTESLTFDGGSEVDDAA